MQGGSSIWGLMERDEAARLGWSTWQASRLPCHAGEYGTAIKGMGRCRWHACSVRANRTALGRVGLLVPAGHNVKGAANEPWPTHQRPACWAASVQGQACPMPQPCARRRRHPARSFVGWPGLPHSLAIEAGAGGCAICRVQNVGAESALLSREGGGSMGR